MPPSSSRPPRPVHEPRREDCPWCGSRRVGTRLPALTLDECRDCAHVFRNPRLTAEGRSLYDAHAPEAAPGSRRLRATARVMLPLVEPESWLDVGTGHAHFPEAAKEVFPYTSFDGLDPTLRVEWAREADRVEEAHVGHLTAPDVLARLRARYDVVSMLHHLARVPDPREELRAALTALRPGGHLLLELPDPHSTFAKLLGKRWPAHTRPHHVHLIPQDNLRTELETRGCTIIPTGRSGALRLSNTYRVLARKENDTQPK
ncbi:class I SAM-dependent methyltransferase [Streptomyces sp. HUAS ZL42]|uniref:class I SAM-dependent methyltransferase n=1 Tax=Streptomyces sp. HUAS ZL42 TaxID=3231715 RepID=UPI00345E6823